MKATMVIRRCGVLMLAMALMLSLAACAGMEGKSEEEIIQDARNGVVRVFATDPESGAGGTGSAFGVGTAGEETQYFVTNWHVVTSSGRYPVGKLEVYIMLSNDAVEARYLGVDEENSNDYYWAISNIDYTKLIKCEVVYAADTYPDVAILKAERKVPGRVALPLRSSRDLAVSSKVYSLGYPGVADIAGAFVKEDGKQYFPLYADVESVHINSGAVSKLDAFGLFGDTYAVEHEAHINHGNSGGPLVDEQGNVVGINTYGINFDQFLNYSVYTDYAMDYLNQLGIPYDYVTDQEAQFPVVPVAAGAAVVLVLVAVMIVLLVKKPGKQPAVDMGLRVQYSGDAMMAGKRIVINGTLRFGRAADCNIRYPDHAPGISSHHCEIVVEKGSVYIRDLNSTHGTFVNGVRIMANHQIPLSVGTEVYLGGVKESFQIVRSTKR